LSIVITNRCSAAANAKNGNVGHARIQVADGDYIQVLAGKPALYGLADADIYHDFHAAASK
jgi:hypothetical protein